VDPNKDTDVADGTQVHEILPLILYKPRVNHDEVKNLTQMTIVHQDIPDSNSQSHIKVPDIEDHYEEEGEIKYCNKIQL